MTCNISNFPPSSIPETLYESETCLVPSEKPRTTRSSSKTIHKLVLNFLLNQCSDKPEGIEERLESWVKSLDFPPSFFLPSLIPASRDKKYPLGIACSKTKYAKFKKQFEKMGIYVFNPDEQSLKEQVQAITSCQKLISLRLDSLKIAHAYQVPVTWFQQYQSKNEYNSKFPDYCKQVGLPHILWPYIYDAKYPIQNYQALVDIVDNTPQPTLKPDINKAFQSFPLTSQQLALLKEKNQPLIVLSPSARVTQFFKKEIFAHLPQSKQLQALPSSGSWQALKGNHHNYLFVNIFDKSCKQLEATLKSIREDLGPCRVILATQNQQSLLSPDKTPSKTLAQRLNYEKIYNLSKEVFQSEPHLFVTEKFFDFPILQIENILDFLKESKTQLLAKFKKESLSHFKSIHLDFPLSKQHPNIPKIWAKSNDLLSKKLELNLPLFDYPTNETPSTIKLPSSSTLKCLEEKFEKIFVINLDRSKDRLDLLNQHLKELGGLSYERFSAVDGYQLPNKEDYNSTIFLRKGSLGTLGCFLSHFKIIEQALKDKRESILILEDDARLCPSIAHDLPQALKDLPKDWDVLFLGGLRATPQGKALNQHLIPGAAQSGFAYALSQKGMKLIYEQLKILIDNHYPLMPVDCIIKRLALTGRIKSYMTKPMLCYFASRVESTHSKISNFLLQTIIKEEVERLH